MTHRCQGGSVSGARMMYRGRTRASARELGVDDAEALV